MAHRGPENAALGAELRRRREALGLEREDVYQAAGITRPTFDRLERGQRTISVEQLLAISRALETDPCDVLRVAMDRAATQTASDTADAKAQHANAVFRKAFGIDPD